jgi:hypothetical protein
MLAERTGLNRNMLGRRIPELGKGGKARKTGEVDEFGDVWVWVDDGKGI